MSSPLSEIYCPFYEVKVNVWSKIVEKIDEFPIFLITSLANPKNTIPKIIKSTNLNPSTVMDTIEELVNSGLVVNESNDKFTLSELGNSYLNVINYLEAFSKENKLRIAVNAFTGEIQTILNEKYFSITVSPNEQMTLEPRIEKFLLKNHNFSNIADYMKTHIDSDKLNISDDDYKYLVFDLKPKQLFYVPFLIPENYLSLIPSDSVSIEHSIQVTIPIQKITYYIHHNDLDKYAGILKQLRDISQANEGLLSDEGQLIVSIYNKVNELQERSDYFDCYSGKKIPDELIRQDEKSKKLPTFPLSSRLTKKCLPRQKNGFDINPVESKMNMTTVISFDILNQKE